MRYRTKNEQGLLSSKNGLWITTEAVYRSQQFFLLFFFTLSYQIKAKRLDMINFSFVKHGTLRHIIQGLIVCQTSLDLVSNSQWNLQTLMRFKCYRKQAEFNIFLLFLIQTYDMSSGYIKYDAQQKENRGNDIHSSIQLVLGRWMASWEQHDDDD